MTVNIYNDTPTPQWVRHPEFGWFRRSAGRKYFHLSNIKPPAGTREISIVNVPESMMCLSGIRRVKKIECKKCGCMALRRDMDRGICRDCIMGKDIETEIASLKAENVIPWGGRGENV